MTRTQRGFLAFTLGLTGFVGLLFVDWRVAVLMFIWIFGNNLQQNL